MAKSQKKSESAEVRKPKAEKPKKQNASNPTTKTGVVAGLDNMGEIIAKGRKRSWFRHGGMVR